MRSVISSLEKLNEFLNLLGSENLIEDDLLIKLKTDFNPEDKVTKTPEPKNLEFKILYEGYMVAFDDTKENSLLKGYLMHPRHQLSESLIAYQAQRDY